MSLKKLDWVIISLLIIVSLCYVVLAITILDWFPILLLIIIFSSFVPIGIIFLYAMGYKYDRKIGEFVKEK
jgi:hypothetical protein